MVTPALFARYPTPGALAAADPADVEEIVKTTGFFRNKTKSLIGMAQALVERFDGEVPRRLDDLVTLPGVGRKTGNVIRSVAMDEPGLPVDTHVGRLSVRLGLTTETDPVKVELELTRWCRAAERGTVQPPADPPWPPGLLGAATSVRGLPSSPWFCPSAGHRVMRTSPCVQRRSRMYGFV